GAVVVLGDAVVVGQLQAGDLFAGQAHEDVDRLLADRHPPHLLEAEILVEGDRAVDLADPVAGVQEGRHRLQITRAPYNFRDDESGTTPAAPHAPHDLEEEAAGPARGPGDRRR